MADEAESSYERLTQVNKIRKIFAKRFGSLKIMRTFATPIQKRASQEEISKLIFGVFTDGASLTEKTQKETERKTKSSLKRLITVQEASTEKIQFIEKR